ncbi:MAG: hypothetical protein GC203_01065 [Phenylobacterium sp.]|uniref:hypothetical protein n=1 Tax=Phenylobacterium sp. TaxID=1871053 RepID=UPI0025D416FA|nr:hypothetical protein [Phenylobacterium sp.]MBI1196433.1 hypothetical protein [Phenylobacterium sp.]
MLRTVLWIAAACAAVLVALGVSRSLHFDQATPAQAPAQKEAPPKPDEKVAAAAPAAAPQPKAQPKTPPTPEELQIQEDAAATGMTTPVQSDPERKD